ncbi:NADH dehydrogenase [ubiquinone] 1 alpha subcomplex subunit 13 [Bombus impatiens]|uniref:NADH dehydrogenase [ubiquinone] 1 alpha subcomplex subunit 13 n=1 Tax=Bombus impatiens TaxID=132113 RepID=A0A6P3V365_BOMIM|nr:NADH dehydrogenase [ubiquinone] 1 alpha subcomplex subunit 13 [Bombus impatiens]
MSQPKTGPQDLPPKGGYAPFGVSRTKLRTILSGRAGVGIFVVVNVVSFPLYYKNWLSERIKMLETKSRELATVPMLLAERDRAILKHQKRMRELEADVMKDFPFWEVGTFFGAPIYESVPEDTYIEPNFGECYTYADPLDFPIMQISHFLT